MRWEFNFDEDDVLNCYDCAMATVLDSTQKGVYLEFAATGERGFAFHGPIAPGSTVLATLRKPADRVKYFTHLVSIDSVLHVAA